MTYAKGWGPNKTTREYLDEFDEKHGKSDPNNKILGNCPKCNSDLYMNAKRGYICCVSCDYELFVK